MNDTFNLNRFGRYLLHDIKNAWRNFGLSGILASQTPVMMVLVVTLFHLVFEGSIPSIGSESSWLPPIILMFILTINAPVKMYGHLTERRLGSDWALLPASTAEKTVSIILTSTIIVPAVCIAAFLVSETVTRLFFPDYGYSLGILSDKLTSNVGFTMVILMVLSGIESIMCFLLGAICFKRAKAGKTILVLILLSTLMSTIVFSLINGFGINENSGIVQLLQGLDIDDVEAFKSTLKWLSVVLNLIFIAVLSGLTYWRVRSIQH